MSTNTIKIPVQPEDVVRFKKWAEHYGMTVQDKKADRPYLTVTFKDPLDLYWLGANMMGLPIPHSSLTKTRF